MVLSARDCRAVGDVVVPVSRSMVVAALYMLSIKYLSFSYVTCGRLSILTKVLTILSESHTLFRLPKNGHIRSDDCMIALSF